jgi:hypothetical protein
VYEFNGYVVSVNDLERMIEEGIQKRQMNCPRGYGFEFKEKYD